MKSLRTVVRIGDFRALLVSYAINRAGDVVGSFALAVVVLRATGSGLATAGLFLCTQFVPGLVGPLLVAHVDRVAVGRLLPAVYVVEACLFGVLAVIVGHVGIPADLRPRLRRCRAGVRRSQRHPGGRRPRS